MLDYRSVSEKTDERQLVWIRKNMPPARPDSKSVPLFGHRFLCHTQSYCWWKQSCTTWDVWNLVNNGIDYQPQLISQISGPSTASPSYQRNSTHAKPEADEENSNYAKVCDDRKRSGDAKSKARRTSGRRSRRHSCSQFFGVCDESGKISIYFTNHAISRKKIAGGSISPYTKPPPSFGVAKSWSLLYHLVVHQMSLNKNITKKPRVLGKQPLRRSFPSTWNP